MTIRSFINDRIDDLGLDKGDGKYIFIILLFTVLFTIYLVWFNTMVGLRNSDVFVFLANALQYSGTAISTTNAYMYLSPVICLLTSILFHMGFVHKASILVVTGVFYILGSVGLYLLFRSRFNKALSFLGVILWSTFAINIVFVADGSLYIPEVSLLIWSFLFLYLGVEKNPKYFMLSFPIFVLAFFTRYPSILFIAVIGLYLAFKYDFVGYVRLLFTDREGFVVKFKEFLHSSDFKYMMYGVGISVLLALVFLVVIMVAGGNFYFLQQTSNAATGSTGNPADPNYHKDKLFYISHLRNLFYTHAQLHDDIPIILSTPSALTNFWLGIIVVGFVLYVYDIVRSKGENFYNRIRGHKDQLALVIGIIITSIVLVIVLFEISPVLSIVLYLIDFLLIYELLKDYIADIDFKLVMISWLMVFMIFYTFTSIKVIRYMIVLTPILAYFIICGMKMVLRYVKRVWTSRGKFDPRVCSVICIVLAVLCVVSAVMLFTSFNVHEVSDNREKAADWLVSYDPDYSTKVVASYAPRYYTWYLKMPVINLQVFEGLDENNVTYYISDRASNSNYHLGNWSSNYLSNSTGKYILLKRVGNEFIYKRISTGE